MKYRLKDRELQAKLDEFTNGEFSKNLQASMEEWYEFDVHKVPCGGPIQWEAFPDDNGEKSVEEIKAEMAEGTGRTIYCRMDIHVRDSEIEVEYDPNGWNPWPEVTPPKKMLMRLETDEGSRLCGYFEDGKWINASRDSYLELVAGNVTRFRPWDDD